MNRIDLTKTGGILRTQDLLNFLQQSYSQPLAAIAAALGDNVIVTGVTDLGANYSDGWVVIAGELLPFVGGLKAANIVVQETVAQEQYFDGSLKDAYYTRTAQCSGSGGTPVTSFIRIDQIKSLTANMATKVNKAGDTLTGVLNFGGNKATSLGNATNPADAVNKSQLDGAITTEQTARSNGDAGRVLANATAASLGVDFNTLRTALQTTIYYASSLGPTNGWAANFDKYYSITITCDATQTYIGQVAIGLNTPHIYSRQSANGGVSWSSWLTLL